MILNDMLKLEVEVDPPAGVLVNQIENTSGQLGGYDWVTPIAGSILRGTTSTYTDNKPGLEYTTGANAGGNWFHNEEFPIAAGEWVNGKWHVNATPAGSTLTKYRAVIHWLDASKVFLSASTYTTFTANFADHTLGVKQAPASTAYARILFEVASTSGTFPNSTAGQKFSVRQVTVVKGATSAAVADANFQMMESSSFWTDVLGPTHQIEITREELNVGTLTATILDATLDPAVADTIRPGRKARLLSWNEDTQQDEALFTGRVSNGHVTYDPRLTKPDLTNLTINPTPGTGTGYGVYYGLGGAGTTAHQTTEGGFSRATWTTAPTDTNAYRNLASSQTAVTAGTVYSFSTHVRMNKAQNVSLERVWYNAANAVLGVSQGSITALAANVWTRLTMPDQTAPANATKVEIRIRMRFGSTVPAVGDTFDMRKTMCNAGATALDYFDGDTADDDNYRYNWTGTAYASTSVAEPRDKHARITLTALDNVQTLANNSRPDGVATIEELPYVLEGCNVPWVTQGSSQQVASATVVSKNESASAVDQIAVTRDTGLGYAWVNRNNVLNAFWDPRDLEAADNVAPTPNFENQVTFQWVAVSNCTIGGVTTGTPPLTYLDVTASAAGTISFASDKVPVEEGLTVDAWIGLVANGSTSRNATIEVEFFNAANVLQQSASLMSGPTGISMTSLKVLNGSVTALKGLGITQMRLRVYVDGCAASEKHRARGAAIFIPSKEITESDYRDIDIDFNTDQCINEVRVKYLQYTAVTGETTEVVYGPYRDLTSIAKWGVRAAEFTYQGDAAKIPDFAAYILRANADPQVRVNSVVIPILDETDLTASGAFLDLYDRVLVRNAAKGIADGSRVTSVKHSISPERWDMALGFDVAGSVASPQLIPPVQSTPSTVPVTQGGSATVNIAATGTPASTAVVFPTAFASDPNVVVSLYNPASNTPQNFAVADASISATGFTVWATRTAGAAASVTVQWIAHGPVNT